MKLNKAIRIFFKEEEIKKEFLQHKDLFNDLYMFSDKTYKVIDMINHPMITEFCVIANINNIWGDDIVAPSIITVWRNDIILDSDNSPDKPIANVYIRDEKSSAHLGVHTTQAVPVVQFFRDTLTYKCESLAAKLECRDNLNIFLITMFALKPLWLFLNTEAKKFLPEMEQGENNV